MVRLQTCAIETTLAYGFGVFYSVSCLHKFVLYRPFLQFCDQMKWILKKIDRGKSAEISTIRIFFFIGRFGCDILQRQDDVSNFASKKAFAEEFSHTMISSYL